MRRHPAKRLMTTSRLVLVACVILGWVVFRITRDYREHGGWDVVDAVSTAIGACFGMLIGVGLFWCKDRMSAQRARRA
jgi:protein-S-isoprenylcysteine O-methyltransferase Ste14